MKSKTTNKQLCGLIKASIVPDQTCEPFFPTREFSKDNTKSRIYHAMCKTCLKTKSTEPYGTVDTLSYCLKSGYCKLEKIFEVWDFEKRGPILKKFVDLMVSFKEDHLVSDSADSKWVKTALQHSYGKFSMKPFSEKQTLCYDFKQQRDHTSYVISLI